MKERKILMTILIIVAAIAVLLISSKGSNVEAGYQSIPTTAEPIYNNATAWIKSIRQMEADSQGLGLNETIDETTLKATESNNIDVHMLKNTEYGAIVLLGASDYGKQGTNNSTVSTTKYMAKGGTAISGTATNLATSTGNITGIYELGYYKLNTSKTDYCELVAGGYNKPFGTSVASRYYDNYTTTNYTSARAGDATYDTDNSEYIAEWQARWFRLG